MNGLAFDAADEDVVTHVLALAARDLSETGLADWIRGRIKRRTGRLGRVSAV